MRRFWRRGSPTWQRIPIGVEVSTVPKLRLPHEPYHLWHSRNLVPVADGRVKNPRHFLLYRTRSTGRVEIGRVLHDSMDFEHQLPEDYRVQGHPADDSSSA